MQNDASHEPRTHSVGERAQPAEVRRCGCRACLDLDADQTTGSIFEHEVDLGGLSAEVAQPHLPAGERRLAQQLACDEALEQRSQQSRVIGESHFVRSEHVARESGVGE